MSGFKGFDPPNKISRTPRSKSEVESQRSDIEDLTFNESKRDAANKKVELNRSAEDKLKELADSFSQDEIAALIKHKGLEVKNPIKYTRHTFQVREDYLKKFQDYATVLSKKKMFVINEALELFFEKHNDVYLRIKEARDQS